MKKVVTWILFIVILVCLVGAFGLIIFYNSQDHNTKPTHTSTPDVTIINNDITDIKVEGLSLTVNQNEEYSFDGVIVYAIYKSGRIDVTSEIKFPTVDTTASGKTKITIAYKGITKEYEITVLEKTTNNVIYITLDTTNVKTKYKINEEVSLDGLIVYAIYTGNKKQAVTDYTYDVRNESEAKVEALTTVGKYQVYITYKGITQKYEIQVSDGDEVTPTIQINDNKVYLLLGLDDSRVYAYYVNLSDGNSAISITANKTQISTTPGITYEVSGYVTYSDEQGLHKINVLNYSFEGIDLTTIQSVDEATAQVVSYSNGIKIGTYEYVNSSPTGYSLSGFALYDNDKLISEVTYDGDDYVIFIDLENKDYRLDAIYMRQESSTISTYSLNPTPGYRIHVVGFQIHCGNTKNPLYRVRMYYQNELLYTKYYEKDSYPTDVFKFILPIKYENYQIIGSLDYNDKISQDQDWEIILSCDNKGKKMYVYYAKDDQKIDSIQYLSDNETVIEPNGSKYDYFEDDNKVKCSFTKWYYWETGYGVTIARPAFDRLVVDENACIYDIERYVADKYVYFSKVELGAVRSYSMKFYVSGGRWFSKTEIKEGEILTQPNTTYTIYLDYSFTNESNTLVTKSASKTITTLSNYLTDNSTKLEISNISKHSCSIKRFDQTISAYTLKDKAKDNSNKTKFAKYRSNFDSLDISELYSSTNYDVIYYKEASSGISYAYLYSQDITTLEFVEPIISEVRLYIDKNEGQMDNYRLKVIGKIDKDEINQILVVCDYLVIELNQRESYILEYKLSDCYNDIDSDKYDKDAYIQECYYDNQNSYVIEYEAITFLYSIDGGNKSDMFQCIGDYKTDEYGTYISCRKVM